MKEIHLTKKDFKVDWFSGTGAGGEYRNKHQNCCRITHIESGLRATGQSHRDRPSNQREAFTKLARMVISYLSDDEAKERFNAVREVRKYSEHLNLVIDASGPRDTYKNVVLKGNGGKVIEERRKVVGSA